MEPDPRMPEPDGPLPEPWESEYDQFCRERDAMDQLHEATNERQHATR